MRAIDADALVLKFKAIHEAENQIYGRASWSFSAKCWQAIEDAPTIAPEPQWIPCSERLPEENVYVLVWCGEVEIAQIVYGISKEQRAKMQEGAIDDPVSLGWNLSNGYFEAKRSETYRACDEYGNNKVPYCWDCIYGEMFGQDVIAWMPLPEPYREERDG